MIQVSGNGAHHQVRDIDTVGKGSENQKERSQDGLIRKEGARERKNRDPTSPRIITMDFWIV